MSLVYLYFVNVDSKNLNVACIVCLLGSAGLEPGPFQPHELRTMIPIFQMRESKHQGGVKQHLTRSHPERHRPQPGLQAPEHRFPHYPSLGLHFQSHCSKVHFPFWLGFLSGPGPTTWATSKSSSHRMAALGDSEKKFSVRVPSAAPSLEGKGDKRGAILKTFGAIVI